MPSRRTFLTLTAAAVLAGSTGCSSAGAHSSPASALTTRPPSTPTTVHADAAFAALEQEFDARLGVVAFDTGTGTTVEYRPEERFAFASTIKAMLAATILQTRTMEDLDRVIQYTADDLVAYSPITEQHVDTGMPLRDVATAAVQYSDNTAANLMFAQLGGPAGVQELLRASGDATTNVDRLEPDLNEATPGDLRDTSTPRALASTLDAYVLGDAVEQPKRELLAAWLQGNTTGGKLIRAAVPTDWTVGDKTGAASYGTRNDIAVLWPPAGAPIVMTVLSSRAAQEASYDDVLIARAAAAALTALGVLATAP